MNVLTPRTRLIAALAVGAVGLFLLFTGLYRNFEWPAGFVGIIAFMAATWTAVGAVATVPTSDAEQRIAPGEWNSWVDTAFLIAILSAMVLALYAHLTNHGDNEWIGQRFGRMIGGLFIAWAIISHLLRKRWAGKTVKDERDLAIELGTTKLSLYMMVCGMIAFALFLNSSPAERLQGVTAPVVAHILITIMVAAHLIGNIAQGVIYTRERLASEG